MLRRLLRLARAAVSAVMLSLCVALCVAAPAAWADSHWRETAVQYRARTQVGPGGLDDRTYRLMSHGGRVGLLVRQTRVSGPIVLLFLFAEPMAAPSEWRVERFRWHGLAQYYPPTHAEDASEWVERRGLGFMYVHQGTAPVAPNERRPSVQGWGKYWAVPYWAVLAAALPLPLWRLRKWHRRRRRVRAGLCPRCGYDLRATPGQCPECGITVG